MDRPIAFEFIKWIDPHSIDEWIHIEELELEHKPMLAAGFVTKEDSESISVSVGLDHEEGTVCCTLVIPKCVILKRDILYILKPEDY